MTEEVKSLTLRETFARILDRLERLEGKIDQILKWVSEVSAEDEYSDVSELEGDSDEEQSDSDDLSDDQEDRARLASPGLAAFGDSGASASSSSADASAAPTTETPSALPRRIYRFL